MHTITCIKPPFLLDKPCSDSVELENMLCLIVETVLLEDKMIKIVGII